jgi:ribosomal protein L6P/L9E
MLIKNLKKLNFCFINKTKIIVIKQSNQLFYVNFSSFEKKNFKENFFYKRVLIFKGLGLKSKIFKAKNVLLFKFGYSHFLKKRLDSDISVKINKKKNTMICRSLNLNKLGTFCAQIKRMKIPDVYKGKGVWFKNEKQAFKQIKKK